MNTLFKQVIAVGAITVLNAFTAHAQTTWPDRPIKVVVPYTPGGGTDAVTRNLLDKLTSETKWMLIVDNKPGAGGSIGSAMVAKSPADGYTIFHGNINNAFNDLLAPDPCCRLGQEFVPVTRLFSTPMVMVVHPSVPANNLKEFIEYGQMYFCPSLPFGTSDVDVSNNTITVRGERFKVGDKVRFTTTTTLPAGLTLATDYWIASYNAATNLITVATSLANALNNVVVDITNQGSGTHTIAVQETVDYPMSKIAGPQAAPFDRYLASEYRFYYIQGDTLFVMPATSLGQVAFAVPYYPATLADLPESNEAENIFLDVLLGILQAQGMKGDN